MKKYRLIKEYPGSPSLGTIDSVNEISYEPKYVSFPEFWEEVVEKDYEIMSFRSKKSKKIAIKVNEMGNYSFSPWDNILNEKDLLEDNRSEIYSIKRLSDGEIFTVGDEIKTSVSSSYASIYVFEIVNDNLQIHHTHNFLLNNQYPKIPLGCHLHLISKCKQPLFTTEDGVGMYKDDEVYTVDINNFSFKGSYIVITGGFWLNKEFKDFSTKEAAEKYILMNKPCLSINDVIREFNMTLSIQKECIGIQKLKALVKEK